MDSALACIPPLFSAVTRKTQMLNETLVFPISYRELDYDSFFAISLWSMEHSESVPLAATRVSVFQPCLALRTGMLHLALWPDRFPDLGRRNLTPGLLPLRNLDRVNQCLKF